MTDNERVELDLLLYELDQISPNSDALEAAASWSLPSELATYISTSNDDFPAVAPGQLWRLSWRDSQVLAIVLSQSSWWTRVVPVTTDVAFADEYTLLAEPDVTSLHQESAVFMRASASVPTFTLAHYLGDVGSVKGREAAEALHSLDVAMLDGERCTDLPTGVPLSESDWDRQEFLDSLHELMTWFESAALSMLDEGALIAGPSRTGGGPAVDVTELLRTTRDLPSLVEATGIAPSRLLNFKSGRAKPEGSELEALSSYFGSEIEGGYPGNKRIAALELISEPANRALWMAVAESNDDGTGLSPRKLYMDLLQTPFAARTVGGSTSKPTDDATVDDWKRALRDQIALRYRANS